MDDDKITSFVTARESLREYIADCDKRLSEIAAERDRAIEELGERVEPKQPRRDKGGKHRTRRATETVPEAAGETA